MAGTTTVFATVGAGDAIARGTTAATGTAITMATTQDITPDITITITTKITLIIMDTGVPSAAPLPEEQATEVFSAIKKMKITTALLHAV